MSETTDATTPETNSIDPTILVIDDNRDNLTTLMAVARDALPWCVLLTALNGPQGIELARTGDPDVILLDIVIPGMDGFEVCRRLKADRHLRDIPVVFLTALKTDRESRITALSAGAEAFLSMPLDEQELVAQVRAMARLKAANREQRLEKEQLAAVVAECTRAHDLELAERKRTEEALRALSSRQEALLAAVPDIIMEVDRHKVYTWANRAGVEFFGEDVSGKEAAFYFEGEQETYGIVQPVFNGDEGVIYVESWQRRKDGEKRLLAWWCRVLKDADGHSTGALSTAHDITERKRAEEKLKSQLEELQRWQDVMLGREDRVQELKREVNELGRRMGEPVRYPSQEAGAADAKTEKPNG